LAGVFKGFDTNNDGSISLEELKEGLQTQLSKEISSASVLEIMKAFDTSGE
jgi:Ca2+-binding EF-hand superfamily protein